MSNYYSSHAWSERHSPKSILSLGGTNFCQHCQIYEKLLMDNGHTRVYFPLEVFGSY